MLGLQGPRPSPARMGGPPHALPQYQLFWCFWEQHDPALHDPPAQAEQGVLRSMSPAQGRTKPYAVLSQHRAGTRRPREPSGLQLAQWPCCAGRGGSRVQAGHGQLPHSSGCAWRTEPRLCAGPTWAARRVEHCSRGPYITACVSVTLQGHIDPPRPSAALSYRRLSGEARSPAAGRGRLGPRRASPVRACSRGRHRRLVRISSSVASRPGAGVKCPV